MGQVSLPRLNKVGASMFWESNLYNSIKPYRSTIIYIYIKYFFKYFFDYNFIKYKYIWYKFFSNNNSYYIDKTINKGKSLLFYPKKNNAYFRGLTIYIYQFQNMYYILIPYLDYLHKEDNLKVKNHILLKYEYNCFYL